MLQCLFCAKKLRADNKIGVCRKHRPLSESRKKYMESYAKNNWSRILSHKRKHYPKAAKKANMRRKEDVEFRLIGNIRNRVNKVSRLKEVSKGKKIEYLGCTMRQLREHIQSKFEPWMTWDNYGTWHIDHIYPLSKVDFNNAEQVEKALHYTNLQPLERAANIKKSNKI